MRAVHIEFLEDGSLPIYNVECPFVWHHRTQGWDRRSTGQRNRAIISCWEEDVMMADLPERLAAGIEELGDREGSLIFPIRGIHTIPATDEHEGLGPFILAGMAFCPDTSFGYVLEGADPVETIMAACGADGVDSDSLHPAAAFARQQRVAHRIKWEQQLAEDKAKKAIVDARSLALLRECLDPHQYREFETYGNFHVMGSDGYTYAVGQGGFAYGVRRIESGEPTVLYCIHPEGLIPSYDLMLAHKLMLEQDIESFHATANYSLVDFAAERPRNYEPDTRPFNMFGEALREALNNIPDLIPDDIGDFA